MRPNIFDKFDLSWGANHLICIRKELQVSRVSHNPPMGQLGAFFMDIEMMPSLHVAQAVAEVAAFEDSHEPIALRAKLVDKVVITFAE